MAHSTSTDQKPSNAPIFVHSSAGRGAAVIAAAATTAKLPLRAATVATKTLVATAMVGAQTNNQLKAMAAMAKEMAMMTATMTNENEGDGSSGGSLVVARRRWWWQCSVGSDSSTAAAAAARRRQRQQLGGCSGSAAAGLPMGAILLITSSRCSSSATVNLKPLLHFFAMVQDDRERSMIEREGWSVDQRW